MAQQSLQEAQAKWKTAERESGESKKKLDRMRKEVDSLRTQRDRTGWTADKEREGESALRDARAEVRKLSEVSTPIQGGVLLVLIQVLHRVANRQNSDSHSSTSPTRIRSQISIGRR